MSGVGGARWGRRFNAHAQSRILDGITCPEVKLTVAIIGRAVIDALNNRPGARIYVQSADFAYWCELINIDPERIRQRLQESHEH